MGAQPARPVRPPYSRSTWRGFGARSPLVRARRFQLSMTWTIPSAVATRPLTLAMITPSSAMVIAGLRRVLDDHDPPAIGKDAVGVCGGEMVDPSLVADPG
jgi:hypothetical protein